MRRVTRNGVIAVAAASGAMALAGPVSVAFAADGGSAASGATADSPGVLSGNTVQLPVHVPVNVCGNTVNVVGLLNPAVGNSCVNRSASGKHAAGKATSGGSAAHGSGKDSPGVVSGNTVQLPVHVPVDVSGNTANVVGVGNAAVGNESGNVSGHAHHCAKPAPKPSAPAKAHPQPVTAQRATPRQAPSLAHTGADQTLPAAAASVALVLGGVAVHRSFRRRATR
ncbi:MULTISPECIES: chaplin [unclassified Streptomyces]|uniref:chaplin n=1 Tax=unclassified Streptomyces TaxID=2593676 RepID=UPI002B1D52F2|nr:MULTISPECIES: chaplin [unclassified Streptomyces]